MTITLTYEDEDRQEAERALKVNNYGLVLRDLDQWLGSLQERDTAHPHAYILAISEVRQQLNDLMTRSGVEYPE